MKKKRKDEVDKIANEIKAKCKEYLEKGGKMLAELDNKFSHENIDKKQKECIGKCDSCTRISLLRNDFSEEGYNLRIMEKKKINITPTNESLNNLLLKVGIPNDRLAEAKRRLHRTYEDAPEKLVIGEYYFYWRKQ